MPGFPNRQAGAGAQAVRAVSSISDDTWNELLRWLRHERDPGPLNPENYRYVWEQDSGNAWPKWRPRYVRPVLYDPNVKI